MKVLSIDGNSVFFPTEFLLELERKLERPVNKIFDMIVGVSSGVLVAVSFAVPKLKPREFQDDVLKDKSAFLKAAEHHLGSVNLSQVNPRIVAICYDNLAQERYLVDSKRAFKSSDCDTSLDKILRAACAGSGKADPVEFEHFDGRRRKLSDGIVLGNNAPEVALRIITAEWHAADPKPLLLSLGAGLDLSGRQIDFQRPADLATFCQAASGTTVSTEMQQYASTLELLNSTGAPKLFDFQIKLSDDIQDFWRQPKRATTQQKAFADFLSFKKSEFEDLVASLKQAG